MFYFFVSTTKLMNASLFFPHLHSLFIVFFVGGLTLRNFGGAKLRITLVRRLTQILPIRGKQRAPDEKAAYPCWASGVPIFVQVCLSTVFYGGYVFIFENINQKNYPSHLHETCRWLFLLYIIMSPPSIFQNPQIGRLGKKRQGLKYCNAIS